ncbi:Gfo/Idh/MocA family oxidoreductase [Clostridium sp. MD294]|uniref:Gfo/Idh/MocA family protein n=1 Tax=Clostridium sp. MD294 TaxID=97138 RepID=UPI0002CB7934|nr:Gfo/Idh/MocA family oxidoreductase [Clostridium sp. MD294]NDO47638.1 Gfo/Idh/MocA family oxidoreductase [Clostridium sp. MD294]USF30045.1 scyllo-inositol 2-dehydrogenase (NADP(+)) IolU [Clostridium sp. MD294]
MKEYRWASLGCGVIANQLAQALSQQGRTLYAVANRTHQKAVAFAQKYNIEKVYSVIEDVFTDDNVDIIYISTPHNTHISYIIQALKNGKHVLCEKSITLNEQELNQAVELAKQNNLILAEAMTIYHMPLYQKLNEIIKSDVLGSLRFVQVNFGSYKEYDMNNRFFNKNLAGGALLDIGVYALSFTRWFFTQNPHNILSQVKFAPTGVDEQAGILLMNQNQEMATISLSLHAKQPKRGIVAYEKGYIEIYDYPRAQHATIYYTEQDKKEVIEIGKTEYALLYEVMDMEKAISGEKDVMCLQYSIDVMEQMTALRKQWGLKYPEEE